MRKILCLMSVTSLLAGPATPLCGQTELRKALQQKYDLRTVSCFTCHARKSEVPQEQREAYKKHPKQFYNDFGQLFREPLAEKQITPRLEAARKLDRDDPARQQMIDDVVADFLQALEQVEQRESSDGSTYSELLQAGTLPGVKKKK